MIKNILENHLDWEKIKQSRSFYLTNVLANILLWIVGAALIIVPSILHANNLLDLSIMIVLIVLGVLCFVGAISHIVIKLVKKANSNYASIVSDIDWNGVYRELFKQETDDVTFAKLLFLNYNQPGKRISGSHDPVNHLLLYYKQFNLDYYVLEGSVYVNTGKGGYTYWNDDSYLKIEFLIDSPLECGDMIKRKIINRRKLARICDVDCLLLKLYRLKRIDNEKILSNLSVNQKRALCDLALKKNYLQSFGFERRCLTLHMYQRNAWYKASEVCQFKIKGNTKAKVIQNIVNKLHCDLLRIRFLLDVYSTCFAQE